MAEVTFRTAAAPDAIRALADRGTHYIVSPGTSRAVVERALEHGVLPLPGAVTATEIQAALELGVTMVKFFPAATSGGRGHRGARGAVRRAAVRPDRRRRCQQPGRVPGAALSRGRRRLSVEAAVAWANAFVERLEEARA